MTPYERAMAFLESASLVPLEGTDDVVELRFKCGADTITLQFSEGSPVIVVDL